MVVTLAPAVAVAAPAVAPAPAASASAATSTVSYARTIAAGRAAAQATLEGTGASSISLALADGARIVWRETFGAVNTAGTAPTLDTVYGIGSVSKMLATASVMQLVDAGRVVLDAPVTRYITDFRMADPAYRQITVRMLLNHTAGLPGTDYSNGMSTQPYAGYEDQVLRVLRTARLKTTPGSMSVYCNDCFTLAGIVVSRVSGKPYTQYVHDSIFAPLGMQHSGFVTSLPPADAFAPVLGDDGPAPLEVTNIYASGGAYSTPSDMSRLATMFINGGTFQGRRILSAASVAEMGTDQIKSTLDPSVARWMVYGLGWDTVAELGLAKVGVTGWVKGGDTGDYHAGFTVAPGERLAVTVLGAGTTFSSTAAEALGETILLNALVDRGTLRALPRKVGVATVKAVRPTDAQLRAVSGIYLGQGSTIRVVVNSDRSISLARPTDGEWVANPTKYTLRRDGRFWSTADPASSVRVVYGWDRSYLVVSIPFGYGHYRIDAVTGERVAPSAEPSAAWQARAGHEWLLVSDIPSSMAWNAPASRLEAIPDLPGYLVLNGVPVDADYSDDLAPMFLVVPNANGRDLNDLEVLRVGGQEWLRQGGSVMRPVDGVPVLVAGANAVPFGDTGYAEWRSVPGAGTVSVSGVSDWAVYSADYERLAAGSGSADGVAVPTGGLLLLFGPAGTTASVMLG
ncbi:MAG: serine hydrolase domain-containing protein [Candidatus Nanopelagicales bacterium]